jgi:hypothetical protein
MGKFEQAGVYWGWGQLIHLGGTGRLCWRAYVASAVRCRTVNESESVSYWSQTLALPGFFFLVQGSIKIQIWCGERRPVVTESIRGGSLGADSQVNMGVWG